MTIYVNEDAQAFANGLPSADLRRVDPRDRRIILVAGELARDEMRRSVDWNAVKDGAVPLASNAVPVGAGAAAVVAGAGAVGAAAWLVPPIAGALFGGWLLRKWLQKGRPPVLPYPILEPILARSLFQFPLDHPIDSLAYACSEAEPFLYVPLSGFHRYMYEAKMAAFSQLCSRLGAKRCVVEYEEEDGKVVTGKVHVSAPTGSVGIGAKYKDQSSESAAVVAEYGRPKEAASRSESGWMRGEPSWMEMQRARLENGVERYKAEFSYASDMGIDASVEAKVRGIGVKTGGSFEPFRKRRWVFDVIFWETS